MTDLVNVKLDTPIGAAAGKAGRYSMQAVQIRGDYAVATNGRILGIRKLPEPATAPKACLIPARAATTGHVTRTYQESMCPSTPGTHGHWITTDGRRKPKLTPTDGNSEERHFPPVDDVLPKAENVRWAHLNGEFLARVAKAIGHHDGGETCQDIYLGIGENTLPEGEPVMLLAGDQRGVGLIVRRSANTQSATLNNDELSDRFNNFCASFKKETK